MPRAALLLLLVWLWLVRPAAAQPQAPVACAQPGACTMRVDTLRTPAGNVSYVHKAWVEAAESYLQVWADPRTNGIQHWHRRWPNRRACGIRGVTTTCRGKESLSYYRFPER